MEMKHHLHLKLTNDELETRPGRRYEGRVLRVVEAKVFNKFLYTREEIVVTITFEDGFDWIPNQTCFRVLAAAWGTESEDWVGRRVAVYLVIKARTKNGKESEKLEKRAEPLADDDNEIDSVRKQRCVGGDDDEPPV